MRLAPQGNTRGYQSDSSSKLCALAEASLSGLAALRFATGRLLADSLSSA